MRTALAAVLAVGVVGANLACAATSFSLAREQARAVASLDATVAAILRNGSSRTAAARPPSASPSSHDILLDTLARGILAGDAAYSKRVTLVPDSQEGKVLGIRLFGVTPDSVFAALGIENGDRIDEINGHDMSSPENAISAYESFRRKSELVVHLNRRGRAMTLHYALR